MKKNKRRVRLLTPDGFDIFASEDYRNEDEAWEAYAKWVKGYKPQGYYSTITNGKREQIPLEFLKERMEIKYTKEDGSW